MPAAEVQTQLIANELPLGGCCVLDVGLAGVLAD